MKQPCVITNDYRLTEISSLDNDDKSIENETCMQVLKAEVIGKMSTQWLVVQCLLYI